MFASFSTRYHSKIGKYRFLCVYIYSTMHRENMESQSSALLLHSLAYKDPSALPRGSSSGIWITRDWILTHGSALSLIIEKHPAISSFLRNMPSGEIKMIPQELTNDLTFQVYFNSGINDISKFTNDHRASVQRLSGVVVAIWKCRLLGKTFDEFSKTWSFPKSTEFDQLLRSVFLLVRVGDCSEPFVEIAMAEQTLSRLLEWTLLRDPVRGTSVEIVSTPFGNPVFIDSIAQGVISNIVGDEYCIIMTDAFAFPGGEGGPVYVISSDR